MSSGISIEEGRLEPAPAASPARDESFRAWHFFVLASIVLATVAVVLTRRSAPEHLILISLTIGAAGAVAAAFYRMVLPLASAAPPSTEGQLTERGRAALERDKMLALRAIKELEFDRAMGKLSQKDFEEMSGRLRQRALALMAQLDGEIQYREIIERDLHERIQVQLKRDHVRLKGDQVRLEPDATEVPQTTVGSVRVQANPPADVRGNACACGTVNDVDAVFCKKCGTRLQGG